MKQLVHRDESSTEEVSFHRGKFEFVVLGAKRCRCLLTKIIDFDLMTWNGDISLVGFSNILRPDTPDCRTNLWWMPQAMDSRSSVNFFFILAWVSNSWTTWPGTWSQISFQPAGFKSFFILLKYYLTSVGEFAVYGLMMLLNPSNEISPFRYINPRFVSLTD